MEYETDGEDIVTIKIKAKVIKTSEELRATLGGASPEHIFKFHILEEQHPTLNIVFRVGSDYYICEEKLFADRNT